MMPNRLIPDIKQSWFSYLRTIKHYSNHTIIAYKNDLTNFFTFLTSYLEQEISIDLLKTVDVRVIRSWLANRVTAGSCANSNSRALSCIKSFYKFLEKNYKIECHAVFALKGPKKSKPLPKALIESESITAITNIATLKDEQWLNLRDQSLLTLIYASGLRIFEALSVTKNDLKNHEFLRVTGKGNKERIVPWIQGSFDLIQQYLQSLPHVINDNEPIFRGKAGKPLQPAVFNRELIKLRRKYNLPESTSAHSFRHSFASHLLEGGADLISISELLGHKALSTTQIYTKVNSKHLLDAYKKAMPL